jgi:hypothetical protein
MLDANKASQAALEVSQRAYVYAGHISTSDFGELQPITMQIGNSGHVPSAGLALQFD